MLIRAPKFHEVAKRIIEVTDGATLVAHNADFDFRMLSLEFDRLGYNFQNPSVCTVELSQQLLPEEESYNLGKLSKSLGIPIPNRHRATGDALATLELFKLLLSKDKAQSLIRSHTKVLQPTHLDKNILDLLENIPNKPGILLFYNKKEELIFATKSRNIKKKLRQLYLDKNPKNKRLFANAERIIGEATGSMLIAELKLIDQSQAHPNIKVRTVNLDQHMH
jgi:DNA polymerase III, alpha subunit (gram-positive type)